MDFLRNLFVTFLYFFAFIIFVELCSNMLALRYLFPIKNAESYGYLSRKSFSVVIPLNKYTERYQTQIMLPVELIKYKLNSRELIVSCNNETKLCGYKDKNEKTIIKENFYKAFPFEKNYAKVAIMKNNKVFYGSIDKSGNWVIEPKYSHICSLSKYYTRACVDDNHCGLINIFGDEITSMSYSLETLKDQKENFAQYFCKLHNQSSKIINSCF